MDKKIETTSNGGKVYLEDGILYKFYEGNTAFIDEKERNVLFFRENPLFAPRVGVTFYDGNDFLGFSQEFIANSRTFKDAIGDEKISDNVKRNAIMGIFKKMRTLHERGILIGDMHSKNVIFDYDDGYIVDLDEVRFKGQDDFKFEELYLIQMDEASPKIKIASEYTDNVKATVSALSLLYGFDFEELVHDKALRIDELKSYVETVVADSDFKGNIFRMLDSTESVIYFDEVLEKENKNVKN